MSIEDENYKAFYQSGAGGNFGANPVIKSMYGPEGTPTAQFNVKSFQPQPGMATFNTQADFKNPNPVRQPRYSMDPIIQPGSDQGGFERRVQDQRQLSQPMAQPGGLFSGGQQPPSQAAFGGGQAFSDQVGRNIQQGDQYSQLVGQYEQSRAREFGQRGQAGAQRPARAEVFAAPAPVSMRNGIVFTRDPNTGVISRLGQSPAQMGISDQDAIAMQASGLPLGQAGQAQLQRYGRGQAYIGGEQFAAAQRNGQAPTSGGARAYRDFIQQSTPQQIQAAGGTPAGAPPALPAQGYQPGGAVATGGVGGAGGGASGAIPGGATAQAEYDRTRRLFLERGVEQEKAIREDYQRRGLTQSGLLSEGLEKFRKDQGQALADIDIARNANLADMAYRQSQQTQAGTLASLGQLSERGGGGGGFGGRGGGGGGGYDERDLINGVPERGLLTQLTGGRSPTQEYYDSRAQQRQMAPFAAQIQREQAIQQFLQPMIERAGKEREFDLKERAEGRQDRAQVFGEKKEETRRGEKNFDQYIDLKKFLLDQEKERRIGENTEFNQGISERNTVVAERGADRNDANVLGADVQGAPYKKDSLLAAIANAGALPSLVRDLEERPISMIQRIAESMGIPTHENKRIIGQVDKRAADIARDNQERSDQQRKDAIAEAAAISLDRAFRDTLQEIPGVPDLSQVPRITPEIFRAIEGGARKVDKDRTEFGEGLDKAAKLIATLKPPVGSPQLSPEASRAVQNRLSDTLRMLKTDYPKLWKKRITPAEEQFYIQLVAPAGQPQQPVIGARYGG